ncbi:MAG: hypothetical protein MZV64_12470 [Ignavibacteriales bacterium]|nr:hypothetical protein [Ignavibacteriales bacterium]
MRWKRRWRRAPISARRTGRKCWPSAGDRGGGRTGGLIEALSPRPLGSGPRSAAAPSGGQRRPFHAAAPIDQDSGALPGRPGVPRVGTPARVAILTTDQALGQARLEHGGYRVVR